MAYQAQWLHQDLAVVALMYDDRQKCMTEDKEAKLVLPFFGALCPQPATPQWLLLTFLAASVHEVSLQ